MNNTDTIILPEDAAAVELVTVKLWKSNNGKLYNETDEEIARWDGATHIHCADCNRPTKKRGYMVCEVCHRIRDQKRWDQMPRRKWDGATPICPMHSDRYFYDEDDLESYCEDHDVQKEDLLLVHCKPETPRPVDAGDLFADYLPEDCDASHLPKEILAAVDALNAAVAKNPPTVWYEGKEAVQL